MKPVFITLLFTISAFTCVRAQQQYDGLEYVRGTTYVAYDHPSGPKIYREREPPSIPQIAQPPDGAYAVAAPEASSLRPLLYAAADDRLAKVVDLKYPVERESLSVPSEEITGHVSPF